MHDSKKTGRIPFHENITAETQRKTPELEKVLSNFRLQLQIMDNQIFAN